MDKMDDRVIQRCLVYAVGISEDLCTEQVRTCACNAVTPGRGCWPLVAACPGSWFGELVRPLQIQL